MGRLTGFGVAAPFALLLALLASLANWQGAMQSAGIDFFHKWAGARGGSLGWAEDIWSDDGRRAIARAAIAEAQQQSPASRHHAAARISLAGPRQMVGTLGTPLLFSVVGAISGSSYDHDYRRYALFSLAAMVLGIVLCCRSLPTSWTVAFLCVGLNWLARVPELMRGQPLVADGNFGLARVAAQVVGLDLSLPLAALLLGLVLAAVWPGRGSPSAGGAIAHRRAEVETGEQEQAYLAVCLGLGVTLLSARLVWLHYMLLILPLALYPFRTLRDGEQRTRLEEVGQWVSVASLAALSSLPRMLGLQGSQARAILFNAAVAALFAIGLLYLRRTGSAAAEGPADGACRNAVPEPSGH